MEARARLRPITYFLIRTEVRYLFLIRDRMSKTPNPADRRTKAIVYLFRTGEELSANTND